MAGLPGRRWTIFSLFLIENKCFFSSSFVELATFKHVSELERVINVLFQRCKQVVGVGLCVIVAGGQQSLTPRNRLGRMTLYTPPFPFPCDHSRSEGCDLGFC